MHPRELGPKDVEAFLTYLAVEGRVSASTQGQALAALLFLYKQVLEIELPWLDEVVRAKRPQRVPTVLTPDEVVRLLACLDGTHALMANLLYGTGMRLMECLRLRVKDVDLSRREITIREGKGNKDRRTMVPVSLLPALSNKPNGTLLRTHVNSRYERHQIPNDQAHLHILFTKCQFSRGGNRQAQLAGRPVDGGVGRQAFSIGQAVARVVQ
jgi:integrase